MALRFPSQQPTDPRLLPKGRLVELSVAPLPPAVALELEHVRHAANRSSSASTQLPVRAGSTTALSTDALSVAPLPSVLTTLALKVPALAPALAQLGWLPLPEASVLPVLVTLQVSVIEMVLVIAKVVDVAVVAEAVHLLSS